jgi:hypothetical protein
MRTEVLSFYASKLNAETGYPARPTIIVEKLTVKLDAQQLNYQVYNGYYTGDNITDYL